MSGIYGVFDTRERNVCPIAEAMAQRLCQLPTQHAKQASLASHNAVLGRIAARANDQVQQPHWDETRTIAVVLAGRLIRDSINPTATTRLCDERFIIDAYRKRDLAFCSELRGSFAAALYDTLQRRVVIVADRMGTFPIYFAHRSGRFLFSPNQHPLLCDPLITADLDRDALAQYMRFQQLLHDASFFSQIKLLRGGRRLIFHVDNDTLTESPYWEFDPEQSLLDDITFEGASEETTRLVVQAVDRCSRGPGRPGIFLSGGMDSRIIVAALTHLGSSPSALTFGSPKSRDAYYARRVAERAGLSHCFCEQTDGQWVKDYWQPHLLLTDASHSWIHMHGIYALEAAKSCMDVNLSGFAGDGPLSGTNLRDLYLESRDEDTYSAAIFYGLTHLENWPSLTEAEEQLLYRPDVFGDIKGRAFSSLRAALVPFAHYAEPFRTELFMEYMVDIRHYSHYLSFKRAALEVGLPFLDPDLMDFVCRLPIAYRKGRRLSRAVLQRLSFPLSQIPYDHDEQLPTNITALRVAHHFFARLRRRTQRLLGMEGSNRAMLHSDYETWLRTDLRDWGESILFDRRTEERGLFNPTFLRSLWNRFQQGKEVSIIGKIAPIMSYELMLREFVDTPPAEPG
ncbi:MAG: hypothetical protein H6640_00965 [Caldilineaceae bacterium]|nr:hypothetical protein [Caldilineaceae bacterium]